MATIQNFEKTENKDFEISYLVKEEGGSSEVLKLLKQHDFKIDFENPVKKIALAYKIKKETGAYFGFTHFKGDPAEVKALNHNLGSNQQILRFLIITPPFNTTKTVSQKPRPIRVTKSKTGSEEKPSSAPLSNEALERKIEEILQ